MNLLIATTKVVEQSLETELVAMDKLDEQSSVMDKADVIILHVSGTQQIVIW
jgi:ABC-type arginine transport system ATPase subunit